MERHEHESTPAAGDIPLSVPAKTFIAITLLLGLGSLLSAGLNWGHPNLYRFLFYAAVAALASGLKVRMPGLEITLSVNFFFNLLTAVELGYSQAIAVAAMSGIIQSYWKPAHRPQPIQIPFNISIMALSSAAAAAAFSSPWALGLEFLARVALATSTLFLTNAIFVCTIMALTQKTSVLAGLRNVSWSYPYYLGGAVLVGLFHALSKAAGWQTALLSLPAVYLVYRSYQVYLDRLESHRLHAEQMSALHLRTIEALAMAIEAKDTTTHDHLGRVQIYALEVGKELGLEERDMEALRAASLLHDIGKLAVPEHIINKPGRLTPEEFEKMKIHPAVGAEILAMVDFPYPIVPVVRGHHEKWDGTGYPDGLKAEEIPLGARIISAVDCLDALASDRQYRRAMPLDQAMAIVRKEAGLSFDPRIVEILERRYIEFERMAREQANHAPAKLSLDIKVERGGAPAAGFEITGAPTDIATATSDSLACLADAGEELWTLLELIQELGPTLRLEETFALVAIRLRTIVPYSGLAAWVIRDKVLNPLYVTGQDAELFSSLRIPQGQGLSGWVGENRKPIVNGNPAVESRHLADQSRFSTLGSAASVPITDGAEVAGVLTLYAQAANAFSTDQVRILETICSRLGQVIEKRNALRKDATAGKHRNGLPTTRDLFLRLQQEVLRCRVDERPISVLLCDLNGFRKVNSQYGEAAGDRLLESIGEELRSRSGGDAYVARLAGDDFAVVLPGVAARDAAERVAPLQMAVRDAGRNAFGEDLVSLSVGISGTPDSPVDCDALLHSAAHDLMRAKRRDSTAA